MGIFIFCDMAENEYNSRAVTVSLTKPNLEQNTVYNVNRAEGKYYTWETSTKDTKIKCNTLFFTRWKTKIKRHTPRKGCINMVIDVTTKGRRILFE